MIRLREFNMAELEFHRSGGDTNTIFVLEYMVLDWTAKELRDDIPQADEGVATSDCWLFVAFGPGLCYLLY